MGDDLSDVTSAMVRAFGGSERMFNGYVASSGFSFAKIRAAFRFPRKMSAKSIPAMRSRTYRQCA